MDSPSDIRGFKQALRQAREARGISQDALAKRLGFRAQSVASKWEDTEGDQARKVPDPDDVFALEAALELPPGSLSRHLGYLPLKVGSVPEVDAVAAIMTDDTVSSQRPGLLALVRLARAEHRGSR